MLYYVLIVSIVGIKMGLSHKVSHCVSLGGIIMVRKLTVGVLIGNAGSAHTLSLMKGIDEAAVQSNVNVLYFLGVHTTDYYRFVFAGSTADPNSDNYDYQCNIVYDYAWLGKVDALVISYGSLCIFLEKNDKKTFLRRFAGIPYVLVEDRSEDGEGSSVITDNYGGMYRVAEHLVRDHGCRSLTYLAGPKGNTDADERLSAVWDVMKKYMLPFTEENIRYGDYSTSVETQAEELFAHFPTMDGMLCANDMMASTVYKVCERHGRTVGKDIAVTGFDDDSQLAPYMEPPLTTVRQNAYGMGMMALHKAVALCRGEKPEPALDEARLVVRASCGFKMVRKMEFPKPDFSSDAAAIRYTKGVAEMLCNNLLLPNTGTAQAEPICREIEQRLQNGLMPYLQGKCARVDTAGFSESLKSLLEGEHRSVLTAESMLRLFTAYLKNLIDQETRGDRISELSGLLSVVTEAILVSDANARRSELIEFQKETWFMPLISRNMIDHIDDEREFYRAALQKIPATNAKSCYLYILDKPLCHLYGEPWSCPERMQLAAQMENGQVEAFSPEARPTITVQRGFVKTNGRNDRYSMCVFPLFSGKMQYGLLLAEIDPTHFDLLYLASQQMDVGLEFYRLSLKQRKVKEALEAANQQLNEKNEILGVVSQYDPLTNCMNRRGFLEAAIAYLHAHENGTMCLYFADVDHLKQINDCFGHGEGDFAICTGAQMLQDYFGQKALTARIGGDEFVVLVAEGEPRVPQTKKGAKEPGGGTLAELPAIPRLPSAGSCIVGIRQCLEAFNVVSTKPYYVELSVGFREFQNDGTSKITTVMQEADRCLYEAKQTRRSSVFR